MTIARISFICILLTLCCEKAYAYSDQFKGAVVRIYAKSGEEGTGFVVSSAPERGEAYIVTAAHVVLGDDSPQIKFFGEDAAWPGQVVRRGRIANKTPVGDDTIRDIALILVRGIGKLPKDVLNLALAPVSHIKGGEFADAIGTPVAGVPWSIIRFSIQGEEGGKVFFTGGVPAAMSGAPLVYDDEVVGMIVRTGGPNNPSIAVSAHTISEFVKGDLPSAPPVPPNPNPTPLRKIQPDEAAVESATAFLNLLGNNRLKEAYSSLPDFVQKDTSESRFRALFKDYVPVAVSGVQERKLADSLKMSNIPGTQIAGDVLVLTFETRFRANPALRVFEYVTLLKQGSEWKVVTFQGNTDSGTDPPGSASGTQSPCRAADGNANPERLAASALELLHTNKLVCIYREYVSDLQKTKIRTEAAYVATLTDYVQRWPGEPTQRILLQSRPEPSEPYFYGDVTGEFYFVRFLAKYAQGNVEEQVYLIKENNQWRLSALLLHDAY